VTALSDELKSELEAEGNPETLAGSLADSFSDKAARSRRGKAKESQRDLEKD
jgi:hypothetical protein